MNTLSLSSPLVSVDWLKQHLNHPQLIILDASAHMPGSERNAYQEWQQTHISGARFFDFNNKVCAPDTSLPHMLPSADRFTQEAQELGINQDSIIVIYDSLGIFSAPRAWWMFTAMGHTQCAVLDGGLPEWQSQAGATEPGQDDRGKQNQGNFVATFQTQWVKNKEDVLEAINNTDIQILDARSQGRFEGSAPEPRAGLISGHIPSSGNLPFPALLTDGKFKSKEELTRLLSEKTTTDKQLYATCGSGITACVIAFAAHLIGIKNIAVYDGSWSEWGQPELGLPIDTLETSNM
jgi:thiosulfate/3-mercaptopyruvate sulfurtransferase